MILALVPPGCGLGPEDAPAAVEASAFPACDPRRVGGDLKCSPREDGTADLVTCATYAYAPDGSYVGGHPVEGCTLAFLASPGVPYTALCVAACP